MPIPKIKSRIPAGLLQELERLKTNTPTPPAEVLPLNKGETNNGSAPLTTNGEAQTAVREKLGINLPSPLPPTNESGLRTSKGENIPMNMPSDIMKDINLKIEPDITAVSKYYPETVNAGNAIRMYKAPGEAGTGIRSGVTEPPPTSVYREGLDKSPTEVMGEIGTTFGNTFNKWLNTIYTNAVNPNPKGFPMNPIMDIPFSEQLTKYIPGYVNPRADQLKDLPPVLKNFTLKDNWQFSKTAPGDATEFVGQLMGGMAPIVLSSMVGIPPSIGFPLIQEAGIQQMLRKGEISESDANWERGAATMMGGLFELPVAKTIINSLANSTMKEGYKYGLTRGGDVLFKTLGTGLIVATKQMAEGKKPDFKDVALNAGLIFTMELFGGHQRIQELVKQYGEGKLTDFARDVALNKPLDPQIQSEVEAAHNQPITDIKKLLLGPREHKFEVSPEGTVTEVQRDQPQEMMLTSLQNLYGMTAKEVKASRERLQFEAGTPEETPTPPAEVLPLGKGETKPVDIEKIKSSQEFKESRIADIGYYGAELVPSPYNVHPMISMARTYLYDYIKNNKESSLSGAEKMFKRIEDRMKERPQIFNNPKDTDFELQKLNEVKNLYDYLKSGQYVKPPQEVVPKETNPLEVGSRERENLEQTKTKITPAPVEKQQGNVYNIPIRDINTDPDRFQNRLKDFSEKTASTIAERYDPNLLDPIIIWKDPANGKDYVLSGHSRLEGMKRRGETNIPARYFEGNEQEAMNYSKIEANRLGTAENIPETIKAYTQAKSQGLNKAKLKDLFDGDVETLDNLQHLNPKGDFINYLNQSSAGEFPYLKRFSRWVGELRGQYGDKLTNAHEQQIFDWIYKDAKRNVDIPKDEFFKKIDNQVQTTDFNPSNALVLKRGEVITGTRAREDTAQLEKQIDALRSQQKEARTPQEYQALQKEITQLSDKIKNAVKTQTDLFSQEKPSPKPPTKETGLTTSKGEITYEPVKEGVTYPEGLAVNKEGVEIKSDDVLLKELGDKLKKAKKDKAALPVQEFLNAQMEASTRKSPVAHEFTRLYAKALTYKNYSEAIQNIKSSKGKFGLQASVTGGFNPELLPDYIKVGKYHFDNLMEASKEKAVSFGEWGIKMVQEFGEYIKPKLKEIWREVKGTNNTSPLPPTKETGVSTSKGEINTLGKIETAKVEAEAVKMKDSGSSIKEIRDALGHDFAFSEHPYTGETIAKLFNRPAGEFPPPPNWESVAGIRNERTNIPRSPIKGEATAHEKEITRDNIVDLKKRYYDIEKQKARTLAGSKDFQEMTTAQENIRKKISTIVSLQKSEGMLEEANMARDKGQLLVQVIKRLPDYESKANTEGYTGQDSIERVSSLIKQDLLTDKSYQRLSLGQKRALIVSMNEHLKEINRERLQIPNDLGEPYVEGWTEKFFTRTLQSSLKHVEKMGEAGKEFAERMNKYHDRERDLMGDPSILVLEAGKLNDAEYQNLADIRKAMMMEEASPKPPSEGGLPQPMNAKVERVNNLFNEYYKKMGGLSRQTRFETTNIWTGEVYPFTPKENYDPRILDITLDKLGVSRDKKGEPLMNQRREKQLQYMVESNQAGNKAIASDMLDDYLESKRSIGKMGNVEFARVKQIEFAPEMYIQDPVRRMISYATKLSRRIAHVESFGMEGSIADRLLDGIKSEGHNYNFANDLYRYETNNLTGKERELLNKFNVIKGYQIITKFSLFTSMKVSTSAFVNSAVRYNMKSAVEGFVKAFQRLHKESAYQSGALGNALKNLVHDETGKRDLNSGIQAPGDKSLVEERPGQVQIPFLPKNIVSKYLKWTGFTMAERFNRVLAATSGEIFYKDMLSRLRRSSPIKGETTVGGFGTARALREFTKMGLNADEIVKRGQFTEEELNLIRRQSAAQIQFHVQYKPGDMPLAWSSPIGKLVTQWKNWSFLEGKFVFDNLKSELRHGNVFPLITAIATFGITGEAVNTITDGIRGLVGFNPKKEGKETESWIDRTVYGRIKNKQIGPAVTRFLDDLLALGSFGLIHDVYRTLEYGKSPALDKTGAALSMITGPTVTSVARILGTFTQPLLAPLEGETITTQIWKNIYREFMTDLLPGGGIVRSFGWTKWLEDEIFGTKVNEKDEKYAELKKQGMDIGVLRTIDEKEKELKKLHDEAYKTKDRKDIDAFWRASDEVDKLKGHSKEYDALLKLNRIEADEKRKVMGRK